MHHLSINKDSKSNLKIRPGMIVVERGDDPTDDDAIVYKVIEDKNYHYDLVSLATGDIIRSQSKEGINHYFKPGFKLTAACVNPSGLNYPLSRISCLSNLF